MSTRGVAQDSCSVCLPFDPPWVVACHESRLGIPWKYCSDCLKLVGILASACSQGTVVKRQVAGGHLLSGEVGTHTPQEAPTEVTSHSRSHLWRARFAHPYRMVSPVKRRVFFILQTSGLARYSPDCLPSVPYMHATVNEPS